MVRKVSKEVLERSGKKSMLLNNILRRKSNWVVYILLKGVRKKSSLMILQTEGEIWELRLER